MRSYHTESFFGRVLLVCAQQVILSRNYSITLHTLSKPNSYFALIDTSLANQNQH
jgi:hypothetical protein